MHDHLRDPVARGDARASRRRTAFTRSLLVALTLLAGRAGADACDGSHSNPVVTENCATSPASWSSDWKVDRGQFVYDPAVLEGYAGSTSVAPGGTLNFYVALRKTSATFRLDVYRLGFYGGAGGRLLKSDASVHGMPQPACAWHLPNTPEQYYGCSNWTLSYALAVPVDWTSGIYLAVLTATISSTQPPAASLKYQAHIVFAVRDDTRPAELYYQQAVATDQAYNNGAGPGLYRSEKYRGNVIPVAKATFDRPFDVLDNTQFYRYELPFITWLEQEGYDVVYGTDVDTHEGRLRPSRFKGLLISGHSEYWSKPMYDTFVDARDQGTHLGFFGGNSLYWQMRLEDQAAPADATHERRDRVMVVYRTAYPANGTTGRGDPNPAQDLQTVLWREFPLFRDEEALVGLHFTHLVDCPEHTAAWASASFPPTSKTPQLGPVLRSDPQPLIVADAGHWVFAGTALTNGAAVPYVYGQEADAFEAKHSSDQCHGSPYEPPPLAPAHRRGSLAVLADSPFDQVVILSGKPVRTPTRQHVNSVIYQACSGAWVFGAGSIMWGNTLSASQILAADYTSAAMQSLSRNIVNALAGRTHPLDADGECVTPPRPQVEAINTLLLTD
jgi:hypothetical protein